MCGAGFLRNQLSSTQSAARLLLEIATPEDQHQAQESIEGNTQRGLLLERNSLCDNGRSVASRTSSRRRSAANVSYVTGTAPPTSQKAVPHRSHFSARKVDTEQATWRQFGLFAMVSLGVNDRLILSPRMVPTSTSSLRWKLRSGHRMLEFADYGCINRLIRHGLKPHEEASQ